MKRIKTALILILLLLVTSYCKRSLRTHENNSEIDDNKLSSNAVDTLQQNVSIKNNLCLIFEKLSRSDRDSIINKNKELLNKHVLSYYDNYLKINNLDTIFLLLNECSTSDIRLAPFYFYVVNKLAQKSDGYVGESINSYFYDFFIKYPGCVYPYLAYLKREEYKRYQGFLYKIINEIDGAEINNDYLDSVFNKHKQLYPDYNHEIDSTSAFIFKNKN